MHLSRKGATNGIPIWLLALTVALVIFRVALWAGHSSQVALKFVNWHPYTDLAGMAKLQSKPVLIYYVGEGTPKTQMMEDNVFSNRMVAASILNDYYPVVVKGTTNLSDEQAKVVKKLFKKYAVVQVPSLVITTPAGNEVSHLHGFKPSSQTYQFLETISKGEKLKEIEEAEKAPKQKHRTKNSKEELNEQSDSSDDWDDRSSQNSNDRSSRNSNDPSSQNSNDRSSRNSNDRSPRNSNDPSSRNSNDPSPRNSDDRSSQNSNDRSSRNSNDPSPRNSDDRSSRYSDDRSSRYSGNRSNRDTSDASSYDSGPHSSRRDDFSDQRWQKSHRWMRFLN